MFKIKIQCAGILFVDIDFCSASGFCKIHERGSVAFTTEISIDKQHFDPVARKPDESAKRPVILQAIQLDIREIIRNESFLDFTDSVIGQKVMCCSDRPLPYLNERPVAILTTFFNL